MIRYREFAISATSLACVSLSSGCLDVGNLRGDWEGSALITASGVTYELPFDWTGAITREGWFGTSTSEFTEFTRSVSLTVDKDDVGELQNEMHRIYTYTYDYGYGDYEPYVANVERGYAQTFSGPVTKVDARQFDIVMEMTDNDQVLVINGDKIDQTPPELPTTTSKVLQCSSDGSEAHCFDGGGNLTIFTR